jgi:hypothetical protein
MEFGPACGSEASAAVMVVNAPGVAPVQSTTALAANTWLDERRSNRPINSSLYPEETVRMVSFPYTLDLKVENSGSTLPQQHCVCQGCSASLWKIASTDSH